MTLFWQAKIWGLLRTPLLKALYADLDTGSEGDRRWLSLPAMQDWRDRDFDPDRSTSPLAEHLRLASRIAAASDRAAIANLNRNSDRNPDRNSDLNLGYTTAGVELKHLLSGEELRIYRDGDRSVPEAAGLGALQDDVLGAIPVEVAGDPKALFWWLWRCLPVEIARRLGAEAMLLPAEPVFPDASVWSQASMVSVLAGSLMGCDRTLADLTAPLAEGKTEPDLSRPYLARFTFSPIQELIKASRKVRDFWSGSWLLHYLSAKVAYALAKQYGPDCLLYPSLYEQPLVDLWLREEYPAFEPWIEAPNDRQLLTAGFPNVIVVILPQAKVKAAMQMARQTLLDAWKNAGREVLNNLQADRRWMEKLEPDAATWGGWLDTQWQTYWSAVAIGAPEIALEFPESDNFEKWLDEHNATYGSKLFDENERNFLREGGDSAQINVGSWWAAIFDRVGAAVASAKNPRSWQLPTAFGPRSTISGLGPVVYPGRDRGRDWVTEQETARVWKRSAGMFDGTEQLNATETLKRGLEKVLPKLLKRSGEDEDVNITADYPDLSSGVAGFLKSQTCNPDRRDRYIQTCEAVRESQTWIEETQGVDRQRWGIPAIDDSDREDDRELQNYPPRLISPGWLAEDAQDEELQNIEKRIAKNSDTSNTSDTEADRQRASEIRAEYREAIRAIVDRHYPNGSPADWYVLAVGDGDSMSEWLKGKRMEPYAEYLASSVRSNPPSATFEEFIKATKRMGPATHNALSRSLLDFSGHLVPYLTEHRYAGRLIYCGGDDVLAYTNLWEWDRWLWDVRQCFRGDRDSQFDNDGHYWRWKDDATRPAIVPSRPLFTLGEKATISFGVVIAHHSVPLAIALEELRDAEAAAKKHQYIDSSDPKNTITKDAVQVRVLYGNGNVLTATSKYDVLDTWKALLTTADNLDSTSKHALFEQAAALWEQHPAPYPAPLEEGAIAAWTHVFCLRREALTDKTREGFRSALENFIETLQAKTQPENFNRELRSWLKLAAFTLRNRLID